VAYPSEDNVQSDSPWGDADASWCVTGDTLDHDSVFVTTPDLAYIGLLQTAVAGFMPFYPTIVRLLGELPGGGVSNPDIEDYRRAYRAFEDDSNPGGLVSLLIGYIFPADFYADPALFPGFPDGGNNALFYSLDTSGARRDCTVFDTNAERDQCYEDELAICGLKGGYAGSSFFDCAPTGQANATRNGETVPCSMFTPQPITDSLWGCEPGLFIKRPVKDIMNGYVSPALRRFSGGCKGAFSKMLVDDRVGTRVCNLYYEQFCDDNDIPEGTPDFVIEGLCGLDVDQGESCRDLSPELNEVLATDFCLAFPTESPGLLENATTPEEGFADGAQSFFSGEDDNNLAGYYHQYQGESRNVLFDDIFDEEESRDAWGDLNSTDFLEWQQGTPEGQRFVSPNVVSGHAVTQVPKGIAAGSTVEFFITSIQRNLRFDNTNGRKSKVKGLETLAFDISNDEFRPYTSITADTENYFRQQSLFSGGQRVCIRGNTGCNTTGTNGVPLGFQDSPMPAGLFNISSVKQNAPLFVSRPYFVGVEDIDPASPVGTDVMVYQPRNCPFVDGEYACEMRSMSDIRSDTTSAQRYTSELNVFQFMGLTVGANIRLQVNAGLSPITFSTNLCAEVNQRLIVSDFGVFLGLNVEGGCLYGLANEAEVEPIITKYVPIHPLHPNRHVRTIIAV
jgi:hypothetical protein